MPQSNFSTMNVEAAAALTCLSSYNAIVAKLNRLWDDQLTQIQGVTDVRESICSALAPPCSLSLPIMLLLLLISSSLCISFLPLSLSPSTLWCLGGVFLMPPGALEESGISFGKNKEDNEDG